MSAAETLFEQAVRKITSRESYEAQGDQDRQAGMVEVLARSLGVAIAVAGKGDKHLVDTLVEGATALAHAEAVEVSEDLARLARHSPSGGGAP